MMERQLEGSANVQSDPLDAPSAAPGDTQPAKPLISLVVPVYNEQDNIALLYQAVTAVINPLASQYTFEFVFTDNHSTDTTPQLLRELARKDKRVRAYRFSRNFGYQRSILTAYLLPAVPQPSSWIATCRTLRRWSRCFLPTGARDPT
jgi:cellulose synthase/poly-beta-1,6-N-acetylglucosamine synthase-like glycosyltransferase